MLRKIRIALALIFLAGLTLLFLGIGQDWWGWMAKLQVLPSALALNALSFVAIAIVTVLIGRIYCSVVCPLGVMQDVVIALRRWCDKLFKRKARAFKFHKENLVLRYAILVVAVGLLIAGFQVFLAMLAPYSAYGRIIYSIKWLVTANGSLAPALLITAGITLVVIVLLAWLTGREYCESICPVGSGLALLSRWAIFRPVIDESKCVHCGVCGKRCKASCIDTKGQKIDMSRCVVCFDCLDNCNTGAIRFGLYKPMAKDTAKAEATSKAGTSPKEENSKGKAPVSKAESVDTGRRAFLTTSALLGAGLLAEAQNKRLDGGLAEVLDKQTPERTERLVPPGAMSVRHLAQHCTSCGLCISNCPNGVLRPSTDLEHFLQPQMGYERGFCRPECTECSSLCPTGAIRPISRDEKTLIRIGTASVNFDLCLAARDEESCGNCSRHCPTGAIQMIRSDKFQRRVPVVMEEQCIGCGSCEFLCPARPLSAITVNGLSTHIHKS